MKRTNKNKIAMRFIIVLFLLVSIHINGFTQHVGGYDEFYRIYHNREGVTTFTFPASLVNLVLDKKDQAKTKHLLDDTDQISFLTADSSKEEIRNAFRHYFSKQLYKDVMLIRNGSSTTAFKVKGEPDNLDEIIMVVYDPSSFMVMCWKGQFTMEDAKRFSKSMDSQFTIKQ